MLDPIPFGVDKPWTSKGPHDAAPTAGGRDNGVSDRDGDARYFVFRSASE